MISTANANSNSPGCTANNNRADFLAHIVGTLDQLRIPENCTGPPPHDQQSRGDFLPLIAQRLLQNGLSEKDFIFGTENTIDRYSAFVCIKTGVWEITPPSKGEAPFYVVTGVSMDDRVDLNKLTKALFPGCSRSERRRARVRMAPTEIAEALTGYQSGTMAPICHTSGMKLYLEESLFGAGDSSNGVLCGSGMTGKLLWMKEESFLSVAEKNPLGMETLPLVQKREMPSPVERSIKE